MIEESFSEQGVAHFGKVDSHEEFKQPVRVEDTKKDILVQGILRKKGLFLMNERMVKLSTEGVLTYFHLDKPTVAKAAINLDSDLIEIRFVYAGRPHKGIRPPHADDEMRIFVKSGNFLFKSMSKPQD
jgi:hypothetical protein